MNKVATCLSAQSVAKRHGYRPVLRGASFELAAGDFAVLQGANGSGKTTLLRVLALLARPDGGTVRVAGMDPLIDRAGCKSALGVVMHQTMHYPELTAIQNLELHGRLRGLREPSRDAGQALDSVGLRPRAHDPVRTFSRGMQQRLALARAMIGAPKVLLLDEPYTGLDDASCKTMNGLLRAFAAQGGCVLLSTHEFQRGLDGRNCILNLEQGRISKASVTV